MEIYQFPSRHCITQLSSSKPRVQNHSFQQHGSQGNGVSLCGFQLGSQSSQAFGHGCNLQLGSRVGPRSRKLKVLSFGHGRSSLTNDCKLSGLDLGFCKSKLFQGSHLWGSDFSRHMHGRVELELEEANSRNFSFVVRSSSTLGVEKEVEREEGGAKKNYDAIVIGSGIGGLVAATQLAVKGAKVLVLEKYVIPGGSSGYYERDGYTFDVGSSVMFGFSDKVSFRVKF